MAPNEVLPTRSHYEAKTQRTDEEAACLPSDAANQKKSRSKKEKKEKKEKSKKAKKEEKKMKKSSKGGDNLILDLVDPLQQASLQASETATHVNGIDDGSKEKVIYCVFC